jgi:hypothetical protein
MKLRLFTLLLLFGVAFPSAGVAKSKGKRTKTKVVVNPLGNHIIVSAPGLAEESDVLSIPKLPYTPGVDDEIDIAEIYRYGNVGLTADIKVPVGWIKGKETSDLIKDMWAKVTNPDTGESEEVRMVFKLLHKKVSGDTNDRAIANITFSKQFTGEAEAIDIRLSLRGGIALDPLGGSIKFTGDKTPEPPLPTGSLLGLPDGPVALPPGVTTFSVSGEAKVTR